MMTVADHEDRLAGYSGCSPQVVLASLKPTVISEPVYMVTKNSNLIIVRLSVMI